MGGISQHQRDKPAVPKRHLILYRNPLLPRKGRNVCIHGWHGRLIKTYPQFPTSIVINGIGSFRCRAATVIIRILADPSLCHGGVHFNLRSTPLHFRLLKASTKTFTYLFDVCYVSDGGGILASRKEQYIVQHCDAGSCTICCDRPGIDPFFSVTCGLLWTRQSLYFSSVVFFGWLPGFYPGWPQLTGC